MQWNYFNSPCVGNGLREVKVSKIRNLWRAESLFCLPHSFTLSLPLPGLLELENAAYVSIRKTIWFIISKGYLHYNNNNCMEFIILGQIPIYYIVIVT